MFLELAKIARKLSKWGKDKEAEQLLDVAEKVDYLVTAKMQDPDDEPEEEIDFYEVIKNLNPEEIAEILLDNLSEDELDELLKIIKHSL